MLRGPFTCDHARHRYHVGAQRVPGIHAVLRTGGIEPHLSFLDPQYRARGKAVHEWTLAYDLGLNPLPLADDAWRPFCDAYVALLGRIACRWTLLEHARADRRLMFASRVDRVGTVNRYPAVVEIKTGSAADFHGPQLAGADLLLGGRRGLRRRIVFYLLADGRFKIAEHGGAEDYVRFLAALDHFWRKYPDGDENNPDA